MTQYKVSIDFLIESDDIVEATDHVWQGIATVIDYYNAEHPYAKYKGVPEDYNVEEMDG